MLKTEPQILCSVHECPWSQAMMSRILMMTPVGWFAVFDYLIKFFDIWHMEYLFESSCQSALIKEIASEFQASHTLQKCRCP